ncbi:hypothetical protein DV738_g1863, partial [Chaetothyriales sp. CBS 135597]
MNGLPDFYGQDYAALDRQHDAYTEAEAIATSQSQTLEQLLESQHPYRRRQTFQSIYRATGPADHVRRSSMMEFGTADFADFAFDPNPTATTTTADTAAAATVAATSASSAPSAATAAANNALMPASGQQGSQQHQILAREDLSLNTQFSRMNADDFSTATTFSPAVISAHTTVDHNAFMSGPMDMSLDFSALNTMGPIVSASATVSHSIFSQSPVSQTFSNPYGPSSHDPGVVAITTAQAPMQTAKPLSQAQHGQGMLNSSSQLAGNIVTADRMSLSLGTDNNPASSSLLASASLDQQVEAQSVFASNLNLAASQLAQTGTGLGAIMPGPEAPAPVQYHNAYSASGFDMLCVLMRVATRKNPEINIGPVDLSCAFVVCDIEKHDLPIVYCSEMFERLTGYSRFEILGRNCRFLQAPDGKVQSGTKRKYVDDRSVLYLKAQIQKRAEAQLSLINYRKGGQPFMNLLTMIPIPWDTETPRFFVGFQVDLVEQPGSLSGKNPDGTYAINYNRSAMPAYSLPAPPNPLSSLTEIGQTIPRDEVSQVLASTMGGDAELSTRIWDKVLLENTDDVVHVLSLKGLFLYLSPASRRVLEYDATELVGTPLSSVCHPSDIVPVTRELKDSAGGAAVNAVYRIRRKKSGYTWFEAHGCLHTEQGKGRKCIILVGRSRPVYALNKNEISTESGPGDSELWSKLSTAGLILFMSSNSRQILDRLPEDLVGTSLQALMRPDSKKDFLRALESARTGEKVTLKHDLQNRRGQVLQAQTTIYPGDAKKGSKPTFLLGQTRLMKLTRASLSSQKSSTSSATSVVEQSQNDTHSQFSSQLSQPEGVFTTAGSQALPLGNQDETLASEDNIFDELKTTRSSSWQFELRQMERQNRLLAEELQALISRKKKRKRRKGLGQLEKDCANCHTRNGRVSSRRYGGTSPGSGSSVNAGSAANKTPDARINGNQPTKEIESGNVPTPIDEADEPPDQTVLPT